MANLPGMVGSQENDSNHPVNTELHFCFSLAKGFRSLVLAIIIAIIMGNSSSIKQDLAELSLRDRLVLVH